MFRKINVSAKNPFEEQDERGYWKDQSDEATAWRHQVFEERRRESDRSKRFDAQETIAFWESYSREGVKWANALREFVKLGGRCEYWGGVPGSKSAIPLTFALFDSNGKPLPCNSRFKDIINGIESLKKGSER